jgi:ATP-dependent Lon protease
MPPPSVLSASPTSGPFEGLPSVIPVLPIRNTVVFPSISMPLVVGRPRSLEALIASEDTQKLILIVTQRTSTPGDPEAEDLNPIGTLCKVESTTATDTGSQQIVVTGISRFRAFHYQTVTLGHHREYLTARGEPLPDQVSPDSVRTQALLQQLKEMAQEILELTPGAPEPLGGLIERIEDPTYLTHVCSSYLTLTLAQKQTLLETIDLDTRMDQLLTLMKQEREVLSVQQEIREKMSERLNKAQREALLREQLRTIRSELGEDGNEETAEEITLKLKAARLPEDANKQAAEELKRLRTLPQASAEYHVVRTYLEWLASLPWSKTTRDQLDLSLARQILDQDHYGLEPVKKRILQFLAVAKLKNDLHGPILCFLGPPGVGKTSLGQSIAQTLGRKFIRASLGGVRDEAEIRGHRRTYVGAMPGRIIQSIRRAGVRNPVILLDEIDKLRSDVHGDPSAAMLEVLDPEQNKTFTDHYLDVPFDLSDVFFIATANVLETIPSPLRDRMEIIEVNGYTTEEKTEIALRHLIAREKNANGLEHFPIEIEREAVESLILHYTREAGVRELQRKIAALMRGIAERKAQELQPQTAFSDLGPTAEETQTPTGAVLTRITPALLSHLLGPQRFTPELPERVLQPGVAAGLAWTPYGGELLYIETSIATGTGRLTLTGQMGDVMKESAQIAQSLARSAGEWFRQFPLLDWSRMDLHVHIPAGAVPKDGPSAGITILAAILSLLLKRPLHPGLCMTGEITLRGSILPVGGIKEKLIAAHRARMKQVLLPAKNRSDLQEVPEKILSELQLTFVESLNDVVEELFHFKIHPLSLEPKSGAI